MNINSDTIVNTVVSMQMMMFLNLGLSFEIFSLYYIMF